MIVAVQNVGHRYGQRTALSQISLQVAEREMFGVLGPNGGGKSTLFQLLSTLILPTDGDLTVGGHSVRTAPDRVRQLIGVVFQSQSLDKKLTVAENLDAQGQLHGLWGKPLRMRRDEALRRLSLLDRRADLVGSLSGGLKRRVEIAKALLHEPKVILMDEPSTGLDPGARRELWQVVRELRDQQGVTVLLTTHLLDEADQCDRLVLLHQGRVVAEGTPAGLKAEVGGDVVEATASDPTGLAARVHSRFGLAAQLTEAGVRVEVEQGHRFLTELVEAFPGLVESVSLRRPTLEDVFLHRTGMAMERVA